MQQVEGLRGYRGAKGDTHFWMHDMAIEVFGEQVKTASGLLTLPYLYKRFGPPKHGHDEYKDIAAYYLTTSVEGLLLFITCSPSDLSYQVGYLRHESIEHKLPAPFIGVEDNEFRAQCRAALQDAMRSLLEPVWVRDQCINIFGDCDPAPSPSDGQG